MVSCARWRQRQLGCSLAVKLSFVGNFQLPGDSKPIPFPLACSYVAADELIEVRAPLRARECGSSCCRPAAACRNVVQQMPPPLQHSRAGKGLQPPAAADCAKSFKSVCNSRPCLPGHPHQAAPAQAYIGERHAAAAEAERGRHGCHRLKHQLPCLAQQLPWLEAGCGPARHVWSSSASPEAHWRPPWSAPPEQPQRLAGTP